MILGSLICGLDFSVDEELESFVRVRQTRRLSAVAMSLCKFIFEAHTLPKCNSHVEPATG